MKLKKSMGIFCICFLSVPVFATSNETVLPITKFQNRIPIVNVSIQGKTTPVRVDTGGAAMGLTLSTWAAKNIKPHDAGSKHCYFVGSLSTPTCRKVVDVSEIDLGNFKLYHVAGNLAARDIGYYKGSPPKNYIFSDIGLDVLNHFGVLLDYPHKKIVLTKNFHRPKAYLKSHWICIPMQYEPGNEIYTHANINGVGANLIWDTGANTSWIKNSLGIRSGRFKTNKFFIDGVRLPRTIFYTRYARTDWDGIVGADFFKKNIVFIDFRGQRIYVLASVARMK